MVRILFVDLSTGERKEERPEESFYRDFIGGYGIGARVLYSRQRPVPGTIVLCRTPGTMKSGTKSASCFRMITG